MNGKWLTLGIVAITAATIAWLRRWIGLAIFISALVSAIGYFKPDVLAMWRESRAADQKHEQMLLEERREIRERADAALIRDVEEQRLIRKEAKDAEAKAAKEAAERARTKRANEAIQLKKIADAIRQQKARAAVEEAKRVQQIAWEADIRRKTADNYVTKKDPEIKIPFFTICLHTDGCLVNNQ